MPLPKVEITPRDVARIAKKTTRMDVSEHDARKWLTRHRGRLSRELREMFLDEAEEMLHDIIFWDHPDPAFRRMNRKIETAIDQAEVALGEKLDLEMTSQAWEGEAFYGLIRYFLSTDTDTRTAALGITIGFGKIGEGRSAERPENPYTALITLKHRKVTARLLNQDEEIPDEVKKFGVQWAAERPGMEPQEPISKSVH